MQYCAQPPRHKPRHPNRLPTKIKGTTSLRDRAVPLVDVIVSKTCTSPHERIVPVPQTQWPRPHKLPPLIFSWRSRAAHRRPVHVPDVVPPPHSSSPCPRYRACPRLRWSSPRPSVSLAPAFPSGRRHAGPGVCASAALRPTLPPYVCTCVCYTSSPLVSCRVLVCVSSRLADSLCV